MAVLVAAIAGVNDAKAAERQAPHSTEQIKLSFAPVVRRVAPAVVNIYTKTVVREQPMSPFFDDPFFRRFFGEGLGGIPRERILRSLGSGVIVRADGYIVTNHHVIKDAQEITVVLADRREFPAELVISDPRSDLAVLRLDPGAEKLPTVAIGDSDAIQVGDLVLAVGNPFGVGQTVTSGIVSALARTSVGIADFNSFIQTDAAVNPGNSGGALVTVEGELIGVNTAIYSKSGGSVGIGFAIPSNMVRAVLDAAVGDGRLVRPWLGAWGQDVTADIAASLGLKRVGGVILNRIHPESPARAADLRTGDIITEVNGREVIDGEGLRFRLATLRVGGTARLTVVRDGATREVDIRLVAPPEVPPRNESLLEGNNPFAGARVANLSPALADELGVHTPDAGVIVLEVRRGSPASFLRVQPGDIILAINDTEIDTVRTLKRVLDRKARAWKVTMRRGEQVFTVTLRA